MLLAIGLFLVVAFCFHMSVRVDRVFRFRQDLRVKIHDNCQEDITAGRDWEWRYDAYGTVSYNDMVLHFWKPLRPNVWWEDTKFLHSHEK